MVPSYGNNMHVCLSKRVIPKLEHNLQPSSYLSKSSFHLTGRRTYLSIPVSQKLAFCGLKHHWSNQSLFKSITQG